MLLLFCRYGSQNVGTIPPNSTLQFEVELKAVNWDITRHLQLRWCVSYGRLWHLTFLHNYEQGRVMQQLWSILVIRQPQLQLDINNEDNFRQLCNLCFQYKFLILQKLLFKSSAVRYLTVRGDCKVWSVGDVLVLCGNFFSWQRQGTWVGRNWSALFCRAKLCPCFVADMKRALHVRTTSFELLLRSAIVT